MLSIVASLVIQAGTLPTPAEVLSKMHAAYRRVRSYHDAVLVYDVIDQPKRLIGRARVSYTAPKSFRYVLDQYVPGRYTTFVQNSRGKRSTRVRRHGGDKGMIARYELFNALDAADTLPFELLFYYLTVKDDGSPLDYAWQTVARERVTGRDCYRLIWTAPDRGWIHLMWVDAKTFFVVKAREDYDLHFQRDEVYIFHPRVK